MGDSVEVVAQIGVHYFLTALLSHLVVSQTNRRLSIAPRPKPHLLLAEVCFEDRADHQHHRHLNHAVANRRYPERALAAITLWYPHSQQGLGTIAFCPKLLLKIPEPSLDSSGVDLFEGLSIDPCRSTVPAASAVGFLEHIPSTDLIPEGVEPIARFYLGFCLQ